MALQTTGAISLGNVNTELSLSATATISMNTAAVRTLAGVSTTSGVSYSMNAFYGKSNGWIGYTGNMAPTTVDITKVAYGGGKYVATGSHNSVSADGTYCYVSSNGTTWTDVSASIKPAFISGTTQLPVTGLAYNGSTWCAVGGGAGTFFGCATSPDGITWTKRTATNSSGVESILWDGTVFRVFSTAFAAPIQTSPDGITWTGVIGSGVPSSAQKPNIFLWNGSTYLALKIDNISTYCSTSTNGTAWTSQYTAFSAAVGSGQKTSYAGVWGSGKFVIIGALTGTPNTNFCVTSPDGITWSKQTGFTTAMPFTGASGGARTIVWTGSKFISTGYNSAASSPDGITWTADSTFGTAFGSTFWPYGSANNGSTVISAGTNGHLAKLG